MTDFSRRPMREDERSFVAKSWVESHASAAMARVVSLEGTLGDPHRGWTANHEYWQTWNGLVNHLLDRARTVVFLDDAGLIAGFMCWQPWDTGVAVHYLYVRLMYRKLGLARLMAAELPAGPTYYTHRSRGVTRVPEGWRFSLRPIFDLLREAA